MAIGTIPQVVSYHSPTLQTDNPHPALNSAELVIIVAPGTGQTHENRKKKREERSLKAVEPDQVMALVKRSCHLPPRLMAPIFWLYAFLASPSALV